MYCDAVNLNKVLFNGRNVSSLLRKSSYVTSFLDISNVGDVGSEGLIRLWTDVSTNFTKLKAGEPKIIHFNGHIGAYLGKEIKVSKGKVNVVECTAAWEHGSYFLM